MNLPATRLAILVAATLLAVLTAFAFGPYPLGPSEVWATLLAGPQAGSDAAIVVWKLRLPRIGDAFGRDHSTIINSCDKVTKMLDTSSDMKSSIADLKKIITEK